MNPDLLLTITPLAETLERLKIGYCVAGSVASAVSGVARSTLNVDIVADLDEGRPSRESPR